MNTYETWDLRAPLLAAPVHVLVSGQINNLRTVIHEGGKKHMNINVTAHVATNMQQTLDQTCTRGM